MWKAETLLRETADVFIERWKGIRVPDRPYTVMHFGPDIHKDYINLDHITHERRTQEVQVRWTASGDVDECTLTVVALGTIALNPDESYLLGFDENEEWEIESIRAEWNRPVKTERLFFEISGVEAIQAVTLA